MDIQQIIQINRLALEQLVLSYSHHSYIPTQGIVCLNVTSRWYPNDLVLSGISREFFEKSGWFKLLTQTKGLVVPSNICNTKTVYPVFYDGQPFLCFVYRYIPLNDPNDFKSKFIPPSVRIITENSVCRLVKYGKYYSFDSYRAMLKEENNLEKIKSFIKDYLELSEALIEIGYSESTIFVIDDKLYTLLDGTYDLDIANARRDLLGIEMELGYYFEGIDFKSPTEKSAIVRIVPEFELNELDSKEVPLDELTELMETPVAELGRFDMLVCILSNPESRKELKFRLSLSHRLQNEIERVYYEFFPYSRFGRIKSRMPTGEAQFVRQFFNDPSEIYTYQEKLDKFRMNKNMKMMPFPISPIVERFSLLIRSYNTLKLKSESAARKSLDSSRWTNYVPINPVKTLNSLVISGNKYPVVLFYNTPLYNAIVLSKGDYNIEDFPYLTDEDQKLIDLWMRGVAMPMTYYAGLSERAFEVLSGPGTFLDLYENLDVRKLIDMAFILGTSPLEYLKNEKLMELELPGVSELMQLI